MKLPLFPLRTVLFPGMPLPLHIFEPRYREMINRCVANGEPFGVTLIRTGTEVGGLAEPHLVGTAAAITRVQRQPDGRMNIDVIGQERFRILALHHDAPYLTGTVVSYPLAESQASAAQQSAQALSPWLRKYLGLLGRAAETQFEAGSLPLEPAALAYLAAIVAQIPLAEKQELLNAATAGELLERERAIYRREVSLLRAMLRAPEPDPHSSFSRN